MIARFVSKPSTLAEVRETLECSSFDAEPAKVAGTRTLSKDEWTDFAENLLEPRDWIAKFAERVKERGLAAPGKRVCLEVKNRETGETLLVDPQGYDYARYVAFPG